MTLAPIALLLLAATVTPSPSTPSPTPSASPCFRTLKFGGALYLDADQAVPGGEVGPQVGTTDPNPAACGLPDRLSVYRHAGHNTSDEVLYYVSPGQAELFRSGGQTGYPYQDLIRWLVLALAIGILLFAALPALIAHVRQPPIGAGESDDDN